MMTPDQVAAAAAGLDTAERTHEQIRILSIQYPDMDMADAYAIQAAWMAMKRAAGRTQTGWKIGLTSKAMQYAVGIDIPDSGVLLDDMMFDDGAVIPKTRFIQPRIEAEIAFVLKHDVGGPNVTMFDVLEATDYIVPALEILDSRIRRTDPETGKGRKVFDSIADNAANAGIVTGGRAMRPNDVDMRWMGAIVSRNGEVEETGLGAGVMNHPVRGIVWLAKRLHTYGEHLEAGQIILAGSFIRPIEAKHGSTITGDYGPYGTVSCFFE